MVSIAGRFANGQLNLFVRSQPGTAKILFAPWTHGSNRKLSARNTLRTIRFMY